MPSTLTALQGQGLIANAIDALPEATQVEKMMRKTAVSNEAHKFSGEHLCARRFLTSPRHSLVPQKFRAFF